MLMSTFPRVRRPVILRLLPYFRRRGQGCLEGPVELGDGPLPAHTVRIHCGRHTRAPLQRANLVDFRSRRYTTKVCPVCPVRISGVLDVDLEVEVVALCT